MTVTALATKSWDHQRPPDRDLTETTLATVTWNHHHHHHQSLNLEGRWGTTDDFATSFLHFSLFSTALWDLPNSRQLLFAKVEKESVAKLQQDLDPLADRADCTGFL